ncbi:uncharacterized protein LOC114538467 [Dendronephthya gigantea]|uniref:uncharacterized protein LOC114538467 n=1 Tax=Dendronephthya gigantea TaxID=151771 RepID=UPI00106C357E|nr:uncharacterized protein LOC114538467 [Dendronephthya gigantea]
MASSVVQGAGFDENRFDGPVSDNFKCTICFNVLNDPKSCQNNQHYFCNACIHQYVQNYSQTCPECRQELTVETLVTPPRILLNCISELRIKCDHVERGCTARVQLEKLKNHLEECGFAPVTCANDGCDAVVNKRDRIHHETELCEFRRVQCHNCEELRNEMSRLSDLSKTTGQKLVKLEGKLDQVTTRLHTIEGNVMSKITGLNLAHERGNASVVQEITEIKGFMNDVLHKLGDINNVVCQMQASGTQEKEKNHKEDERVGGPVVALGDKEEIFAALERQNLQENLLSLEKVQQKKAQAGSLRESRKGTTGKSEEPSVLDGPPVLEDYYSDEDDNSDDDSRNVLARLPAKERKETPIKDNENGAGNFKPIAGAAVAQSSLRSTPLKSKLFNPKKSKKIKKGTQVIVRLNINNHVRKKLGMVQYVGTLPFDRKKTHVGVELYSADGDNDGVFDGKRYFQW